MRDRGSNKNYATEEVNKKLKFHGRINLLSRHSYNSIKFGIAQRIYYCHKYIAHGVNDKELQMEGT
jgi:hypothetical protein